MDSFLAISWKPESRQLTDRILIQLDSWKSLYNSIRGG